MILFYISLHWSFTLYFSSFCIQNDDHYCCMMYSLPTESQNNLISSLYMVILLLIAILISCTYQLNNNTMYKFLSLPFLHTYFFWGLWSIHYLLETIICLYFCIFPISLFIYSYLLLYVAIFCSQIIPQLKLQNLRESVITFSKYWGINIHIDTKNIPLSLASITVLFWNYTFFENHIYIITCLLSYFLSCL